MNEFQTFSAAIHGRFTALSAHELFVVGDDNRAFEAHYLASFPEGTNPVYKTNTEHDCTCCKQFIRNIGNLVAIIDGEVQTVWGAQDLPYPYDIVARAMDSYVKSLPITDVFRTQEGGYGAETSRQMLEDGNVKVWNHFHGKVAKRHQSATPDAAKGLYRAAVQVFGRGLNELKPDDLTQVRELIEANGLYRGEEHLPAVKSFQALQQSFQAIPDNEYDNTDRANFIWAHAMEKGAGFRNTVIGTLLQELAEGKDFEGAVKSFEAKVAPANYKRPTALITPRMIQDATAKIAELGLESALQRRFANIGDVTVNNVLWVDNSVKGKMKGGLEDLLMSAVKTPAAKDLPATDIGIDDFMKKIVPTAAGMKVFVENSDASKMMSLTAPVHADVGQLFKWDNNFGWSYTGNITDSIKERVGKAGGNITNAKLRVSLAWNNYDDLDIYVHTPGGMTIYFANKRDWLDVDMNAGGRRQSRTPVENVSFKTTEDGIYRVSVNNYVKVETDNPGFTVEVENAGKLTHLSYAKPVAGKQTVNVCAIVVKAGLIVEIKPAVDITAQGISQEVWGVKTETFVPVSTLMLSPNHWDDNAVGNKHWFFVLEDCKNDRPARGIYNEFLRGDLEQHRKVFETLGNLTKCPVAEDQLSGLGFSSTRGDTVLVQVTTAAGMRNFKVKF